ncbi:MAG: hypothetical protein NT003_02790 [Candidatus Magasanikbacteria bacterium]|nr:hypothetical protein [Candidatus Magasanikbacteria bacterium]
MAAPVNGSRTLEVLDEICYNSYTLFMPQRVTADFDQTVFHAWEIPEYTKYPHTRQWYIIAGSLLFITIIYSVFFDDNYLFAFILLLITIVFVFHEMREPRITQFGITDEGVIWHGILFPYREIRNFWILYEPGVQNIYFVFKNATTPRLTIPLMDEDPTEVRDTLKRYLFEDIRQDEEPLSDVFGKVLKF